MTPSNGGTFTAAATGRPDATVQWQVQTTAGGSWADLPGQTGTTLTSQSGYRYRAVFSNGVAPDAQTNPAQLSLGLGFVGFSSPSPTRSGRPAGACR